MQDTEKDLSKQSTESSDDLDLQSEQTYDSVFWSVLSRMQEYLIPLVNEAFGKHYSPNARVSLKPMKQVTRGIEGSLNRRDTDSMATIIEDSDHSGMDYHKAFLMEIMNRVFQKMAIKYQNITKGVDQVMGGYIIKTYADEILEKGIEQGIGQGIEQGTNRTMLHAVDNYVTKLHVSEKEACETLGFDYSEFLKAKDVSVS